MSNSKKYEAPSSSKVQIVAFAPMGRFRPCVGGILLRDQDKEKPVGVSMTVPNEGISLKELVVRFAKTGDARIEGGSRDGYYTDSDLDDEDLEKLSQADLHEQSEAKETMDVLRAQAEARKAMKAEKAGEPAKEPDAGVVTKAGDPAS